MFDPSRLNAVQHLTVDDLARLPREEDGLHEYKSGATPDNELAKKLARAASGFWNSGGGMFVAGVDKHGQPDRGVSLTVVRQSRRDWVDQVVSRVMPTATYSVACVPLDAETVVLVVGFGVSEYGPHMAPDNIYYIRGWRPYSAGVSLLG